MALIYEPRIFKKFPEVRAAITLRGGGSDPYGFNMSLSVGDDHARVIANRALLARRLGFDPARLATQRQVHGDTICEVVPGHDPCESDALITSEAGWLLAISAADCIPVLIYEPERGVVAGVHSGWRGSLANVVGKTVERLVEGYRAAPEQLQVYVGASAGQCCYEVGPEVATAFDPRHSRPFGEGKYLFDNRGVVLGQLLGSGLLERHIELDLRCTICDTGLQSYRRDGPASGRMFGVIGMKPSS
jgi:YfiH family protein